MTRLAESDRAELAPTTLRRSQGTAGTRLDGDVPTYSLIIPVHNEQEVLTQLFAELDALTARLDGSAEFVMVDDGSADASWSMLVAQSRRDVRYRLVRLSRNFGHQVAVSAGLDHAEGDAVVIMDADLQDPPEVVLEMARRWREGYQIAYGHRIDRDDDTWFKRTTASGFYRLLNRLSSVDIPAQVGDFRLIDRMVVDAIKAMPERNRYVRGMFAWLGFSQIAVPYQRPGRWAGTTSYSLKRMVALANDGVIGFSKLPLRSVFAAGIVTLGVGITGTVSGAAVSIITRRPARMVSPSLSVLALGAQLTALGIVGEYVSRTFDESLGRPLYVVQDVVDGRRTDEERANSGDRDRPIGRLHEMFEDRHPGRPVRVPQAAPLRRSGS